MEINKQSEEHNLQDLHSFLKVKFKPEPIEVKPAIMTELEMSDFFNQNVLPAFRVLKNHLTEFSFENIGFNIHTKIAVFKVSEELSQFFFKVEIDNIGRVVDIHTELRYREGKNKKLIRTDFRNTERISFKDIDKISEKRIISLFSKWYMNKDEQLKTLGNKQ